MTWTTGGIGLHGVEPENWLDSEAPSTVGWLRFGSVSELVVRAAAGWASCGCSFSTMVRDPAVPLRGSAADEADMRENG
jgi:hypothetical protein